MPTALVTGATSGIGLAFVRALATRGYDVVLVARDLDRLNLVGDQITAAFGVRCQPLSADLADLADTGRVETRLRDEPVDLLVNNAGFGLRGAFETADLATEQQALDVMIRAVMRLTHAALGPMLDRGSGDIVNVSSIAGFLPRGTYGATKGWVTSFSAWGNAQYRGRGVRMMALCPGFVRTEFHQRLGTPMSGTPRWLWLDADDVVRAALDDLQAGKAISVPSLRYKVIRLVVRLVPRRVLAPIVGRGR